MSQFEQISAHVWIMHAEHETDRPLLAAVVGERRTLLMDGGASPAHAAQLRQELIDRSLRLPDILFEKKLELDLGGVSCEIHHVGGDHAGDSCYLYVREDKTLFLGDALGPSVYGGPRRYTSGEFLRLMDAAFHFDAHIFVESHSTPVGKAEFHQDIDRYIELARLVGVYGKDRSKIAAGLKRFLQVQEISQEFANALEWFLTD